MPPIGKFVHGRRLRIYRQPTQILLLGVAGLWIGCAGRARGEPNPAPPSRFDLDPGTLREERRAAPDLRFTPWRSLDAMIEEARIKSGVTLTPEESLRDQKKRLELPAETKIPDADYSALPMNAANKIWEAPAEKTSSSGIGLFLTLGAALAAFVGAWKAGWFRRKMEKSAS